MCSSWNSSCTPDIFMMNIDSSELIGSELRVKADS